MTSEQPAKSNPRPLGLPSGSIRAILALTLVGLVVYQTVHGQQTGLLLSEALMIVLAHYFASRRVVKLPPDVHRQLEERGLVVPEPNPLWLPRGAVRLIILVAFGFLALALLFQGRLLSAETFATVGLIFAFLLGVTVRWIRGSDRNERPPRFAIWVHTKALLVLATCALVVLMAVEGELKGDDAGLMENLLLGFVLFYFGSR